MHSTPRFLQGIFPFEGQGVDKPAPLHDGADLHRADGRHHPGAVLPRRQHARTSWSPSSCVRDGAPMRYFPIGARERRARRRCAVVEDLDGGTVLELHLAAPEGLTGTVVVDLGLVEV